MLDNVFKEMLISVSVMHPPNWSLQFKIMCNASAYIIGAVLGKRRKKKPYVVYNASMTFNDAQMNYTSLQKEFL